MSEKVDLGQVPPTDSGLTGPKLSANNVIYAEHLLSFWKSEILVDARHRVPT